MSREEQQALRINSSVYELRMTNFLLYVKSDNIRKFHKIHFVITDQTL